MLPTAQQPLKANRGKREPGGEEGKISIFMFFCFLVGFKGPEGFQGVPGGRGYVLTKFGLKRTHLTLVHTRFHVFFPILGGLGPWALVDTSCRSQLDMDLDISDLGFDRISIHKMGGCTHILEALALAWGGIRGLGPWAPQGPWCSVVPLPGSNTLGRNFHWSQAGPLL